MEWSRAIRARAPTALRKQRGLAASTWVVHLFCRTKVLRNASVTRFAGGAPIGADSVFHSSDSRELSLLRRFGSRATGLGLRAMPKHQVRIVFSRGASDLQYGDHRSGVLPSVW
jgi:hypothetical protein